MSKFEQCSVLYDCDVFEPVNVGFVKTQYLGFQF